MTLGVFADDGLLVAAVNVVPLDAVLKEIKQNDFTIVDLLVL
jgi:hypothetical protein